MIFAGVHDMEHLHHWYQWFEYWIGIVAALGAAAAIWFGIRWKKRKGER